ncbi:MAG TPA: hypothetical protein VGX45_09410 [Solirubrobacteraceae bacterium]|jgi:hypothetical protein|nr:hypothetical protein [Solirubrobacteraceae bacterium]
MSLQDELRGPLPAGIRELTDAQRQDLADAITDARHRQAAALADAGERAFGHIPRLLRGPIRRMFS